MSSGTGSSEEQQPLATFDATQLAALMASKRAEAKDTLVKHAHSLILDYVAKGLTSFEIYHPVFSTEWAKDAQFIADALTAVRGYFQGTTIEYVESGGLGRFTFAYSV